ncbi:unnamed protein product, partial [Prorocentrum cordatum]
EAAGTLWSAASWACQASGVPPPPAPAPLRALARKQVALLKHVWLQSKQGDVDSVLEAIESFARTHEWLKIAGGDKARLLAACVRAGKPRGRLRWRWRTRHWWCAGVSVPSAAAGASSRASSTPRRPTWRARCSRGRAPAQR